MNSVNVFSLILAIGASFGLLWVLVTSPNAQRIHWLLAAWIALLGALLGSRLFFVLEHLFYYSKHVLEIPQFWQGGLTWEGALAGGVAVIPLIDRLGQWPFTLVAEKLSRLVLPLAVASWAACWWSGLGYGVQLQENFWWGMTATNEAGAIALRTPVQPLAIFSLLVFFGVLELWLNQGDNATLRAPLTLLVLGTHMLLFTLLRADPAPSLLGLRIETWLALVYTLAGLSCTILLIWKKSAKSLHFPKIQISWPLFKKKVTHHETSARTGTN